MTMKIIPKGTITKEDVEKMNPGKILEFHPFAPKFAIKADVNNGKHKITAPGPFVPPIGMCVDIAGFRYRVQHHHVGKAEITLRAIGMASKLKRFSLRQAILMAFHNFRQRFTEPKKETTQQAAQQ